jgi:hypothetical protein
MAYDRADWHYGGDYPEELSPGNGGTHIGIFLAWAIIHHLEGALHREESQLALAAVRERRMTGREFLFQECDEKFWEEDLNDEGNEFTAWYYDTDDGYFGDYERVLSAGLETLYHVADTWDNYDKLSPVIDSRFAEWRAQAGRK